MSVILNMWGEDHALQFVKQNYFNGNLAIEVMSEDEEYSGWEPWCSLTVNLPGFMLDENDTPWLTDLNPRVTATIILYAGAGMNFPYLRIKQLLGEELPKIELKYGTKLVRKYWDVLFDENGIIQI